MVKKRSQLKSISIILQIPVAFWLACIGLLVAFTLTRVIPKPVLPPPSAYIPPPLAIQYLTAGMKNQMASALWIRAMGDLDYCEEKINERDCKGKSWLYHVFNLATEMDPPFEPFFYQMAGLALTVIVSDYAGASVIFDRGVVHHPDYWALTYAAGYHAYFEEQDYVKAGRLYALAAQHGAPTWVGAMAGRLAAEGGDLSLAEQILNSMKAMNIEEKYIERLHERLESVRKREQNRKND